jgi:hypothetical protein
VYLDQFAKVFIRARIAGSGLDNRNFREYRRATPKIDHGKGARLLPAIPGSQTREDRFE